MRKKMDKEQDKEMIELPQIHIPDEIRQVDSPEIGVSTPHPDTSDSPNVSYGTDDFMS